MAERTPDRLTRLLALVAHLSQAGPTPLVDLARFFGVSPQQIRKDIDVLWLTGTPGICRRISLILMPMRWIVAWWH